MHRDGYESMQVLTECMASLGLGLVASSAKCIFDLKDFLFPRAVPLSCESPGSASTCQAVPCAELLCLAQGGSRNELAAVVLGHPQNLLQRLRLRCLHTEFSFALCGLFQRQSK